MAFPRSDVAPGAAPTATDVADGRTPQGSDVAPTVVSLTSSSVTTPENMPANNSGSFADYDDPMTITASQGTLVDNGNGSWSWSQTGDEINSGTVTITVALLPRALFSTHATSPLASRTLVH